jgi:FkbM family methyltransferase
MKIAFMGRQWDWNQEDAKLIQVNGWINDLNAALDVVAEPFGSVAIQAGGAMGVWPWVMAEHFHHVYTFEPHPVNFECLERNVEDRPNITAFHAGLSDHDGFAFVKLPPSEVSNAGAYYLKEVAAGVPSPDANTVPIFKLDTLVHDGDITRTIPVGLIQLDIEGLELKALQGAREIIKRDQPVIMVEEKPLPQDKETGHVVGATQQWLINEMGYTLHRSVHRDLIFVPRK